MFYQPEGEILTSRLLYHPMLPEGVEAAYLPLLRAEGEELAMPMFAWSEMDAQESVPPAVVWRNATTAMAQYSGEKELRFADMDGITAVYLAKVDEDGQTDDGADRLQPLSLMDIRNDDGKLPLPDGPGLYAYVVDKTVNGGLARYGLAFQVRE